MPGAPGLQPGGSTSHRSRCIFATDWKPDSSLESCPVSCSCHDPKNAEGRRGFPGRPSNPFRVREEPPQIVSTSRLARLGWLAEVSHEICAKLPPKTQTAAIAVSGVLADLVSG